jgi:hypothetical protein
LIEAHLELTFGVWSQVECLNARAILLVHQVIAQTIVNKHRVPIISFTSIHVPGK